MHLKPNTPTLQYSSYAIPLLRVSSFLRRVYRFRHCMESFNKISRVIVVPHLINLLGEEISTASIL
jgi:hypothetical protein